MKDDAFNPLSLLLWWSADTYVIGCGDFFHKWIPFGYGKVAARCIVCGAKP